MKKKIEYRKKNRIIGSVGRSVPKPFGKYISIEKGRMPKNKKKENFGLEMAK
ncbi:MAG: hypothetical protein P8M34_03290 [Saprospiraceae bacterium]|nr:hypothetical protein [Saprospiraceae bacterium]|tara:strand:- start:1727 stop:1882 length:156 start_codon:yes stop_codon:yes gene_type:complete